VVVALFFLCGCILGYWVPFLVAKVTSASYDRSSMDKIMKEEFLDFRFSDILTHELLVFSYAYNEQEPRFYSKFFKYDDENKYDVKIGQATGASAAAPTFFDPQRLVNDYNMTEYLIDGGIICNNPALYSYQIATKLYKKKKVRVVSLGTGESPFKPFDPESVLKKDFMGSSAEFMMNIETYTSDWGLQMSMDNPEQDYLRMQTVSALKMDKVDKENIDGLVQDGEKLYKRDEEKLKAILRLIIDDALAIDNSEAPKVPE
jgi:predicted acylesterase/phospholipase RssA